jgi:hypothetical protein
MAKVIEFYIPQRFQKNLKWVPQSERGKVLEFSSKRTTSALRAPVVRLNTAQSVNSR